MAGRRSERQPDAFEQRPFVPPRGATEIVLVRHGASEAAVEGVRFPLVEGRGDPALAAAGLGHAEAVAELLGDLDFATVFVSSLRRTHETAVPLLRARGVEPTVVAELSEVFLGDFEGGEFRIRVALEDPIVQRMFSKERWDEIPGAEPAAEFEARVRVAIARIVAATGPDRTAVAVAHGGVIGEICRLATGARPFAFVHSDNGSVSRLVVEASGNWILRSFNEIEHL